MACARAIGLKLEGRAGSPFLYKRIVVLSLNPSYVEIDGLFHV